MSEKKNRRKRANVVVGVDGSDGAKAALRWAFAEARLRKAPLRVVHALQYSYMGAVAGGYAYMGGAVSFPSGGAVEVGTFERAARELIHRLIHEVAGDATDVAIDGDIIDGSPDAVLIGAVAADDLLVVGSRGHGGFAGLLLGSVSQQCVEHAPCPVVVVHPASGDGE